MDNIQTMDNQDLWLYYEITYKRLTDIKTTILEEIMSTFGWDAAVNNDIFIHQKKFHAYCAGYRSTIQKTKKQTFLILLEQEHDIQKEIHKRQLQMLKDLGIAIPSVQVRMIMDRMKWQYFPLFDDMITYIKHKKEIKEYDWPEDKNIHYPEKIRQRCKTFWTTILDMIENNEGISQN